jgi:hypothetical protein
VGKHFNSELHRKITPQEPDDDEPEYSPEEDWEAGFSDWKHNKDDDLATAVRRYAMPVGHVRLFDEVGVGR